MITIERGRTNSGREVVIYRIYDGKDVLFQAEQYIPENSDNEKIDDEPK